MVGLTDHRGKPVGTALYSSSSQIAIRMISPEPVRDLAALIRQRIAEAISYRERVVHNTEAYRVIFSEADFIPGLIVDRYGDILSLQILTQALDSDAVREAVIAELTARLNPASIVERVDPRVRELEKLPERSTSLLQGSRSSTTFTMSGVQFRLDALQANESFL